MNTAGGGGGGPSHKSGTLKYPSGNRKLRLREVERDSQGPLVTSSLIRHGLPRVGDGATAELGFNPALLAPEPVFFHPR